MGRAYGHDSGQGRGFETSRPVFSVLRRTLSSASISVSTVWRTASARARGRHAFRVASVTSNAWETRPSAPVWKSKFYGAFVLNHRVVLHAIDATPARWRGDAGSSPLDRARSAPDTLVDFHTGSS